MMKVILISVSFFLSSAACGMEKDYYAELSLPNSASETEIRQAYCRLGLQWHPDKNLDNLEEATKRFQGIGEAYSVLSDAEKKELYDEQYWIMYYSKLLASVFPFLIGLFAECSCGSHESCD